MESTDFQLKHNNFSDGNICVGSPQQFSSPNMKSPTMSNSDGTKLISKKKIKIKQSSSTKRDIKIDNIENNNPTTSQKVNHDQDFWFKNNWESCSLNEEFIVLLQKEIKRLQNITNDLSYQLIMNGHTPQIKESERVPIDLSINPLRRREQKNCLTENKCIPSKTLLGRSKTSDICENTSNTSTQADNARPNSGFRIRDQNGTTKYSSNVEICENEVPDSPRDKGPSKAEKYHKEKDFVKNWTKDTVKKISSIGINYKSGMKKLSINSKSSKSQNKNVMLPPLEAKDEAK